jgi:hypothetical protein
LGFASHFERYRPGAIYWLIAASLTITSCDESLPPRLEDPNTLVFAVKLESGACSIDSTGVYGAGAIDIQCTNTYYEVLQDSEHITVQLDMWLVEHPEANAHVSFYAEALRDSTLISRGLLTLVPHHPAELYHQWNHKTSAGRDFYSFLQLTLRFNPLRGVSWLESDTTTLAMQGSVQIFKKVPPYTIPLTKSRIVYEIY